MGTQPCISPLSGNRKPFQTLKVAPLLNVLISGLFQQPSRSCPRRGHLGQLRPSRSVPSATRPSCLPRSGTRGSWPVMGLGLESLVSCTSPRSPEMPPADPSSKRKPRGPDAELSSPGKKHVGCRLCGRRPEPWRCSQHPSLLQTSPHRHWKSHQQSAHPPLLQCQLPCDPQRANTQSSRRLQSRKSSVASAISDLLQFLSSSLASIHTLNLCIKHTHARTHTHTHDTPNQGRENTLTKTPQNRGLGLETRVTSSPFPPHQAGGQRTLGNTRCRPRQTSVHLFGSLPFGSWSPSASLRATAADNFSEINKPVWMKQAST